MKINRIHSHRFQLKFRFAAQTAGDRPDPVDRQRLCDDVLYFHPRIQAGVGVLKNQLSAALEGFFLRGELFFITDVSTVVEDLSAGWLQEIHDAAGQCGFSRAGFSDQAENFTPADLKGDVIQCGDRSFSGKRKAMRQMADVDQRSCGCHFGGFCRVGSRIHGGSDSPRVRRLCRRRFFFGAVF